MAEVIFETERLVLRSEAEGDQATWLDHVNTPEAMEHLGGVKTAEQVAADFARMAEPGEFPWGLLARKHDHTLVGKCGLGRIEGLAVPAALRGEVQVGWTVRPDLWRQGYGREAAVGALDLAFDRYALPTVYAQTSERNIASARLMESIGMTRRPEFDYVDPDYSPEDNPTIIYGIEREQWRKA